MIAFGNLREKTGSPLWHLASESSPGGRPEAGRSIRFVPVSTGRAGDNLLPRWASQSRPRSMFANAIEVLVVAQEQLAVADGERCVGSALITFDDVMGQQLKFRLCRHDEDAFLLRNVVELAVGEHRGCPDLP